MKYDLDNAIMHNFSKFRANRCITYLDIRPDSYPDIRQDIYPDMHIVLKLCWDVYNIAPNVFTKFHANPFMGYYNEPAGYPTGYPDHLQNA